MWPQVALLKYDSQSIYTGQLIAAATTATTTTTTTTTGINEC